MLQIQNVSCEIGGKQILNGFNLEIKPGEVHAIMGPNGTGKSTLSHLLTGREGYELTQGKILLDGQDLNEMTIDERAKAGLFLAFQYPVEIPGVSAMTFLKSSLNAVRKSRGEDELDSVQFLKMVKKKAKELKLDDSMLKRAVNQGFSGGEKKRFEILQMALLEPKLTIFDEIDSGLDVDALRTVSEAINNFRSENRSFLMITHYQRLLDYVKPDIVHIVYDGKVVTSGGFEIAEKLEKGGYAAFGMKDVEEVA